MFKVPKNGSKGGLVAEILMIVIGINVALWFEGWFQDLSDAETEAQYLVELRDDLRIDIQNLDNLIEVNTRKVNTIGEILGKLDQLNDLSAEEQASVIFAPSSYLFFQPSDFTYRSMQESGDFRLLSNTAIKKGILRLDRRHKEIAMLQNNFLQALDDGYIPLMMDGFDIVNTRIADPGLYENVTFRNFFAFTVQDTEAMVRAYEYLRSQSKELLAEIDEELGDD